MRKTLDIAIDFGTSTSEIASLKGSGGQYAPDVFTVEARSRIMPSVVWFEPQGQITVGKKAEDAAIDYPDNVIQEVKREMGIGAIFQIGGEVFTSVQIAGEIFKKLYDAVFRLPQYSTFVPGEVVISVPHSYRYPARQEIKKAAQLGGFGDNIHLIEEGQAAIIRYELDLQSENPQNILIFDFGGGTLDVCIYRVESAEVQVKGNSGDPQLGGKDIDLLLMSHIVDKCKRENPKINTAEIEIALERYKQFSKQVVSNLPQIRQQLSLLKRYAKVIKEELSEKTFYSATIPILGKLFTSDITRQELSELIEKSFSERILNILESALNEAEIERYEIDNVLLVGGSSRISWVRDYLRIFFDNSEIVYTGQLKSKTSDIPIDYDLTVVEGAALYLKRLGAAIELTSPADFGIRIATPKLIPRYQTLIRKSELINDDCIRKRFSVFSPGRVPDINIPVFERRFKTEIIGSLNVRFSKPLEPNERIEFNFILNQEGNITAEAIRQKTGEIISDIFKIDLFA